MVRSISTLLFLVICFVTSCGQAPAGKKLIDEINAAKVKARELGDEAERKRSEANKTSDKAEHDKLIEEAAKHYGEASDNLEQAAQKARELARLQSPPWYAEYFGLQSKLFSNFAQLAAGAHEELLVRKSGALSESQVRTWKDNIKRIKEENEELRKQIDSIESRQGIVLIKE